MTADHAPFTQARICRALAAARASGLKPTGFSIAPDGTITVHSGDAGKAAPLTSGPKLRDAREALGCD
jgi:hypothetical protein